MCSVKKHIIYIIAALSLFVVQSCTEDVDMSDRYTFTGETVASYLEKHEEYSDYYRLLGEVPISSRSESTVLQLMSARGNYTVFAPDNNAVQMYLDSLYEKGIITEPTWDGFDDDEVLDSIKKVIVYNSIIDSGDDTEAYSSATFPGDNEEFLIANLNDRKLVMNYGIDPDSMYINGTKDDNGNVVNGCPIDVFNHDIYVINGYIHEMHKVIAPSNDSLADLLWGFISSNTEGFLVMAKLVMACGLGDTLSKYRDEVYEELYQTAIIEDLPGWGGQVKYRGYLPEHRKYGFTIFAERDAFWRSVIGKSPVDITPEDVKEWVISQDYYPDATTGDNYSDINNVLNKFVTYHMLPMRIPTDKLVLHYNEKGYYYATSTRYTVAINELYTTMGERRLFKIYQVGNVDGIYLNRFPNLDNGRTGTYQELSCDADKQGFLINTEEALNVVNGYLYPIDAMSTAGPAALAYNEDTRYNFQKQRLRFDATSLFQEMMTNDIRGNRVATDRTMYVGFTCDSEYQYLENMSLDDNCECYYMTGLGLGWPNYQGDAFYITGRYDVTVKLPPVPAKGTYQFRYLSSATSSARGICQVYFGSDTNNLYAMGIPLDMGLDGTSEWVGWEEDTGDEDIDAETDKKMRNKGFMKGPELYHAGTASSVTARNYSPIVRRIMITQDMEPGKTYYVRFKSVLDSDTHDMKFDFFEYCAKEIYDNPNDPEDIW